MIILCGNIPPTVVVNTSSTDPRSRNVSYSLRFVLLLSRLYMETGQNTLFTSSALDLSQGTIDTLQVSVLYR